MQNEAKTTKSPIRSTDADGAIRQALGNVVCQPETLTTLANKEAMLKLVCKQIYQCIQVCSDEHWEDVWKLHTDPHSVKMGGTWEVINAANRIMRLLNVV